MKRYRHPFEKVHKKRGLFLQIGFILSLALVIMAFQWKTPERKFNTYTENTEEQVFVMDPVPRTKMKTAIPESNMEKVQKEIIKSEEVKIKIVDDRTLIKTPLDSTVKFTDFIQNNQLAVDSTEFVMPKTPYRVVEDMPEFPGGNEAIPAYLAGQAKYPEVDYQIGIEGTVYLQFVVDENGQVGDVIVQRGVSNRLDREAMRVVQNMPRWKPGRQQGHAVPVYFQVKVKFKIQH